MTLLEKHGKCLADLILERREAKETWWQMRLDQKISDMKRAIVVLVKGEPCGFHSSSGSL